MYKYVLANGGSQIISKDLWKEFGTNGRGLEVSENTSYHVIFKNYMGDIYQDVNRKVLINRKSCGKIQYLITISK